MANRYQTLSVTALRAALDGLQPDDRVAVNTVSSLKVFRDGKYIAYIALTRVADEQGALQLATDQHKTEA